MTGPNKNQDDIQHFYVDEAGDPNLFTRRGKILLGEEGCSNYFLLGKLDVDGLDTLVSDLQELRTHFLADPYFKGVPSFQPDSKKTAVAFHAKNDIPEVRREVFKLLMKPEHKLRFYAVVRDKKELLSYVKQENERKPNYKYNGNELYDSLVTRLFSAFHHVVDFMDICYSRRGNKLRSQSFQSAIIKAEKEFESGFGMNQPNPWSVRCSIPKKEVGLQAVDYFLWALQRFYEKSEERYLEYIWPKIGWVHDLDFIEEGRRGIRYNKKQPLNLRSRDDKKKRRGI